MMKPEIVSPKIKNNQVEDRERIECSTRLQCETDELLKTPCDQLQKWKMLEWRKKLLHYKNIAVLFVTLAACIFVVLIITAEQPVGSVVKYYTKYTTDGKEGIMAVSTFNSYSLGSEQPSSEAEEWTTSTDDSLYFIGESLQQLETIDHLESSILSNRVKRQVPGVKAAYCTQYFEQHCSSLFNQPLDKINTPEMFSILNACSNCGFTGSKQEAAPETTTPQPVTPPPVQNWRQVFEALGNSANPQLNEIQNYPLPENDATKPRFQDSTWNPIWGSTNYKQFQQQQQPGLVNAQYPMETAQTTMKAIEEYVTDYIRSKADGIEKARMPVNPIFQASGNFEESAIITPTEETMKTSQQLTYRPPMAPYQPGYVCRLPERVKTFPPQEIQYAPPPQQVVGPAFQQQQPKYVYPSGAAPTVVQNYIQPSPVASPGYVAPGPQTYSQPMNLPQYASPTTQGYAPPPAQEYAYPPNPLPNSAQSPNSPMVPYCIPVYQFPSVVGSETPRSSEKSGMDESPGRNAVPDWISRAFPGITPHCPPNSFRCNDGSNCIPKLKWCDSKIDCRDASDETKCTCKDRIGKRRLCDGYIDCPHGEDELGCFGCPPESYSCGDWSGYSGQNLCYTSEQRCDGNEDCSNGNDEKDCNLLSMVKDSQWNPQMVGHSKGYLHRNWKGKWYPVCSHSLTAIQDACAAEIGTDARNKVPILTSTRNSETIGPFIVEDDNGVVRLVNECPNQLFAECPAMSCGTRIDDNYKDFQQYASNFQFHSRRVRQSDVRNGNPIVGSQLRVVGGKASLPKAWPYVVVIYKNGYFHCGGVIIDESWILTAAHCFTDYNRHYYEIQAGQLRRSSFSPMSQRRKVDVVHVHPQYDYMIMKNDLTLVHVDKPLIFNRWVRPACLPRANEPQPNTICIATGWGAIHEHGPDPDHLREVEVPVLPKCKHKDDINDAAICAGYVEGGRDACQGDSGGPLLCRTNNGEGWYVGGIVSHGEGCARPNEPGVYAKVGNFVDWINSITRGAVPKPAIDPLQTCPSFRCNGPDGMCLPHTYKCDRKVHCLDAEDEIGCSFDSFRSSQPEPEKINTGETPIFENNGIWAQPPPNTERSEEGYVPTTIQSIVGETEPIPTPEANTMPPDQTPKKKRVFNCQNMLQTVPITARCNNKFDCEDATDEENCTCKDYLTYSNPDAICDNHVDCPDRSDEDGCNPCKEGEFYCPLSAYCIQSYQRCDFKPDCRFNEDERDCIALTNGASVNLDLNGRPHLNREGVLTRYTNGIWHPECYNNPLVDNDPNQKEIGQRRCEALGFKYLRSINSTLVPNIALQEKSATKNMTVPYEYPPKYRSPNPQLQPVCNGLYVSCEPTLTSTLDQHIRINSATGNRTFSWPWEAAVFTNGKFKCPAILLENDLLLGSVECSKDIDLSKNYTTALLGMSPSHNAHIGPHEQISQVVDVKALNKSDAVLLRLKSPINATRYAQPVFENKRIFPAANGDTCIAHGLDSNGEKLFKILQPIVDTCSKCHRCYTDQSIPADCIPNPSINTTWSGTIVCHGQGGWYPAAVFRDKDVGCGFKDNERLESIDFINPHITETKYSEIKLPSDPLCDGLRCNLGACVPWNKVCDGIFDCRDGIDESSSYCRHTEVRDSGNYTERRCNSSELRCNNGQCLPKSTFCDGKVDCFDGTDEPSGCSCRDYFKLTNSELVCNGILNCIDKSDESPEYCLCKDSRFPCSRNSPNSPSICVSPDVVCDGENDCPQGEDEKLCSAIKGSLYDHPGTGVLVRRDYGQWHTYCYPTPVVSENEVRKICNQHGFNSGSFVNATLEQMDMILKHDFKTIRINDKTWLTIRDNDAMMSWEKPAGSCYRIAVQCY